MRAPRIGLALGCGGARALVHIGVIKALEDNKIPIHAVSGCSMGAYIGALWATGKSPEEMIRYVMEFSDKGSFKKLSDPAVPPIRGLYYGNLVKADLKEKIGEPRIEELERKYIAIAANLDNYQRVVLNKGDLLSAVHASCAMPGIVVPVNINGIRCVDGGVVDPVPVGVLHDYADVDLVIAVSTTQSLSDIDATETAITVEAVNVEEVEDEEETKSWLQSKLSDLGKKYNRIAHESCKKADVAIQAEHGDGKWDEFENFEHYIAEGAKAALAVMDEIKQLTEPIPDNTDHE